MKSKLVKFLVVAAGSVINCACVTTPYVAPQSGPVADLAIRINPTRGTHFTLAIYDNAETCSGARTLMDDAGKISIASTKLVANKLTTFSYYEVQGNLSCTVNFSFLPEADHIYVLDTASGRNRCNYRILDATDKQRLVGVPLTVRTVGGAMCLPMKK